MMTLSNEAKQIQKAAKRVEKELDISFSRIIKQRDGFVCAICGQGTALHCHHIIPREDRQFRHDYMNGITLCCLHHKFSLEISPHKNAFAFFLWLEGNRPEQYNYLQRHYGART